MSKASLELGGTNWATKDGKLLGYAQGTSSSKFVPREFTFTRGSDISATRVNSSGLIEKYRENLILQSNTFDTTWTTSNVSVTGGQSGYDGSNDAWLLSKAVSNGNIYQVITTTSGVQSFSVYAKANSVNWIRLRFDNSPSADQNVWINLTDGSVGTDQGIASYSEIVGNGWYRLVLQANTTDLNNVRIYPAEGDTDTTASSGSIYIQDAQLEYGLVATDYIETGATTATSGVADNEPRIDYTGGSPALLLEPQRTNLFTHSEYLDGFTTAGSPAPTLTANYAESPQGVDNAYRVEIPSASGLALMAELVAHTSGTKMTVSAYVKSNTGTNQSFQLFGDYGTASGKSGTLTATSEWQRFTFTFTPTATGNRNAGIMNVTSTAADLLVYGMQIETASYATSYIPTYGTSVTRSVDSCEKTGISSLIGDSEGTLYLDSSVFENDTDTKFISLSDGSSDNRIDVRFKGNGDIQFTVRVGASTVSSITTPYIANTSYKIAAKYANNNFALWVNGVEVGTDNSGSTFASGVLTDIDTNDADGGNFFYGNVKQLIVFPTALSNTELAALTTI